MPKHLQVESGFGEEDVSSISSGSGKRTALFEEEIGEAKRHRKKLDDTMQKVSNYLEVKTNAQPTVPAQSLDDYIRQVAQYSQMMKDNTVLSTMSPDLQDTYVASLQKQRKVVLRKLSIATEEEAQSEDSE